MAKNAQRGIKTWIQRAVVPFGNAPKQPLQGMEVIPVAN
jgi:hypothetical protein